MGARGLAPRLFASLSVIITSAAAPSEIDEDVAAVTVPSLPKAGRSVGIFSMFTLKGVSSSFTTSSPLRPFTVTAAISSAKAPGLEAPSARVVDSFRGLHARLLDGRLDGDRAELRGAHRVELALHGADGCALGSDDDDAFCHCFLQLPTLQTDSSKSSRPMSMRRISLVPAPMS